MSQMINQYSRDPPQASRGGCEQSASNLTKCIILLLRYVNINIHTQFTSVQ